VIELVISGGQTGADQAGLRAARACGLPTGVTYKTVSGFPGYVVGDDGTVWSWKDLHDSRRKTTPYWRKLKPSFKKGKHKKPQNHPGYFRVTLTRDGNHRQFFVHVLVLETFVGPRPPGMQACHFPDRDTKNNHLTNLRWDTPENNAADKMSHGTVPQGEAVVTAKLTDDDIPKILRLLEAGVAMHRIAYGFDVSARQIFAISKGHSWKQLTDTSQRGMKTCSSSK
jgi:hypothetical protein